MPKYSPVQNNSDSELFGVDSTLLSHKEDEASQQFTVDNLTKYNRALADRATFYRRKYEQSESDIGEKEVECRQKIRRIREFYQKFMFSENRSAEMVRMAINNKSKE